MVKLLLGFCIGWLTRAFIIWVEHKQTERELLALLKEAFKSEKPLKTKKKK